MGVTCRPCGTKTHFGPLSKNNTGMAALRASLPVKIWTQPNLTKPNPIRLTAKLSAVKGKGERYVDLYSALDDK